MRLNLLKLVLLFTVATSCKQEQSTINKIDATELSALMAAGELQLVDVRTKGEVQRGAIDGALHFDISREDFAERIKTLDKNMPTVVYCAVGSRSAMAAAILKKSGFDEIYDLTTGYSSWNALRK